MNTQGSVAVRLTDGPELSDMSFWSQGGLAIGLISKRDGDSEIQVKNLNIVRHV